MYLRLVLAAALCASLLFTGCAKTHETTTDTTTSTAQTDGATTEPAADAQASPADASASTPAPASSAPGEAAPAEATAAAAAAASNGSGAAGLTFIDLPVYPGATENPAQGLSVSSNGTSITMKVYSSRDDTKRIIDWYKAHLPASFKNFAISSGDKTTGTFSAEGSDGDQSIIVGTQDDKTTRIQLSTKHGH